MPGFLSEALVEGLVERPFFLEANGRRLFAVEHEPSRDAPAAPPLLVVHPWFEEKLWAHRVLLDLSRRAAAAGHHVLRFDAGGHGDSDLEVEAVGFADWERDAATAWSWLQGRAGRDPDVFGLRLGGTVAGRLAAARGVRAALWEPAVDPAAHLLEVLRANLTFQMRQHGKVVRKRTELVKGLEAGEAVLIEGYGLASRFWIEAAAAGLTEAGFPGGCPAVFVASVSKASPRPGGPLEAAATEWRKLRPVEYVEAVEDPFWSDVRRHRTASPDLTLKTLAWLGAGA